MPTDSSQYNENRFNQLLLAHNSNVGVDIESEDNSNSQRMFADLNL